MAKAEGMTYGFSKEGTERIVSAVRMVEGMFPSSEGGFPQFPFRSNNTSGNQMCLAELDSSLTKGGTVGATIQLIDSTGTVTEETGNVITVVDFLLQTGQSLDPGTRVICCDYGGVWVIVNWQCPEAT